MNNSRRNLVTRITPVVGLLAWAAAGAVALDNSYVTPAGGLWSAAGSWSLGHCPTASEAPTIVAGSTANKIVVFDSGTGISYPIVKVDGHSSGYYGLIHQMEGVLTAYDMQLGTNGAGWHWLEGPAYTWVNDILYVGYQGAGSGHFYMSTVHDYSAGLYVGDLCYVGYGCAGDFDHTAGIAQMERLYVGQSDPGTYHMRAGRLELAGQFVLGNGDAGTFDQTGGAVDQSATNGLIVGLNTGGSGTYLMKAGTLDLDHISLAWNGDAYFTQSGGTVTTVGDLNIGCQGTHPMQTYYKLNQDNGTAVLNIGDDMLVGPQTYAKYEQTAGTCNIAGDLEIWKGSDTGTSRVYLGTSAGLLDVAGEVINHTGYYDQDGGVMSTSDFTNDSTDGVNLDNNADFRATHLNHNAGTFWMWRNAQVRGELALPPSTFWMCNFTNDATFQMGSVAFDGGTFGGHLTNNGTFNYYQGDFSGSTLTNYGTFNNNAPFTCNHLVNHANITVTDTRTLTVNGTGYAEAFENDGNLTMYSNAQLTLGTGKALVNNGNLYAGAASYPTITGDVVNNGYLVPSYTTTVGRLNITGTFTANASAELRIRIGGTSGTQYDRLTVQGAAQLGGELQVYLMNGFVPSVGNTFKVLYCGGRTGKFDTLALPVLPSDRAWQLNYSDAGLILEVIVPCRGDANCDGQVDFADINPFVDAIMYDLFCDDTGAGADVDGNGSVGFEDINPFVDLLMENTLPIVCP